MRSESIFLIRASEWTEVDWMPTCQAFRDTQGRPMASSAMAHSATEICSPVDRSMSISRLEAWGLISSALAMRSSVVSPWADRTTMTSLPWR